MIRINLNLAYQGCGNLNVGKVSIVEEITPLPVPIVPPHDLITSVVSVCNLNGYEFSTIFKNPSKTKEVKLILFPTRSS